MYYCAVLNSASGARRTDGFCSRRAVQSGGNAADAQGGILGHERRRRDVQRPLPRLHRRPREPVPFATRPHRCLGGTETVRRDCAKRKPGTQLRENCGARQLGTRSRPGFRAQSRWSWPATRPRTSTGGTRS